MTIGDVLTTSTRALAEVGSETPRLDAELLVGKALGLRRSELYVNLDRPVSATELDDARELVERRARHEPVQYIVGEWGFRQLTLTVDARALIPRPETECVVERALALLAGSFEPRVLDVGTGTGAIALALADERPGARVTAIDVSRPALELAQENAARAGLRVEFVLHDVRDGLPGGPWELVVSNPPYVDPADRDSLAPEIRDWEPAEALFGTGIHELIAAAAVERLAPGGALVLEVGDGQSSNVASALERAGYRSVRVSPDLAGRDRVVEGVR